MRVAHVIDDYSARNGGLTTALQQLSAQLILRGVESTVYSVGVDDPRLEESAAVICRANDWSTSWRFSTELFARLGHDLRHFDLVHVHGIWRAPQLIGLVRSRTAHLPTVLSPHNMLGGWLWRRSWAKRVKKRLYFTAFQRLYRGAARIHALSPVESDTLHAFFPETPIDVIPNGIELGSQKFAYDPTRAPYFLYLGRLFPGKGIELLLEAFAKFSRRSSIRLVLAGASSDPRYEQGLRERALSLGIQDRLSWTGHVAGPQKDRWIGEARAVFLPSFSEGVSMVALETLAAATPLVASREIGVPEVGDHGGVLVDLNPESILQAMHNVAEWGTEERIERGRRSRELAQARYCWSQVAPQFQALYERTLTG